MRQIEQKADKIKGHIEHVKDAYIGLKAKYQMLEPMINDESTLLKKLDPNSACMQGFLTVKSALFFSCVQDIANLSKDKQKKTPSLVSIFSDLEYEKVMVYFKNIYANSLDGVTEYTGINKEQLAARNVEDRNKRSDQFMKKYCDLKKEWKCFRDDKIVETFKKIRNKRLSHLELKFVNGNYIPYDIQKFNLKWCDIGPVVKRMEYIVFELYEILACCSYDIESIDETFSKRKVEFWKCFSSNSVS